MQQEITDRREWLDRLEIGVVDGSETEEVLGVLSPDRAKDGTGETMIATNVYPTKTREMHNHHFDSTIWNDFDFRDDDIVISTYAKSGTTWTQQIVAQLLFGPDPDLEVAEMSPWLDLRVPPRRSSSPWSRRRPTGGS